MGKEGVSGSGPEECFVNYLVAIQDNGCRGRMEPLWNVMKKGLLAGDTLR
jgi:hypothetical protein